MGIQGLLPQLKSIMVPIHAKDLSGQRVAVDTYSWLHKGALSCSRELCKGLPTSRHIDYCMHRVNLLRHFGIKPILVFDGGLLPMKVDQETKRSRIRKENLERAMEHESAGNSAAAYECYQKAVDISPLIAYKLIQTLKVENIDYIVAPYEADAQMTFLAINKHVDAVITEDSDLIPFGCSRIIYKMDKFGQGVEFRSSLLGQNKELNFSDFTKQMFLEMCILSGCDYLQSLPGMGLRRAHALIQKFKSYDKVIKHLKYSAFSISTLYEESFKKAILTFRHQRVYDPEVQDIVHLSDIPNDLDPDLDFMGPSLLPTLAKGIAKGYIDPFTKLPFEGERIHVGCVPNKSYSLEEFKPTQERKRLDLPAQKNVLTNYFCLASLEAKRKYMVPKGNFNKLVLMEESLPSDEECVHLDNGASSTINYSKNFVLISNDCDGVRDKLADKSNPTMELACGGNLGNATKGSRLMQLKQVVSRPFLISHSKLVSEPSSILKGQARSVNRDDIPVQSYMGDEHDEPLDSDSHSCGENRAILQQEDADEKLHGNTKPQCVTTGNNCLRLPVKKQKLVHSRNKNGEKQLEELTKIKPLDYAETSFDSHDGNEVSNLMHKNVEKNEKQKFQCDISHLSHYSGIAEKSMKRFVSVISSFSYVSSGSRASGLRAPLKDIQNLSTVRSSIAPAEL